MVNIVTHRELVSSTITHNSIQNSLMELHSSSPKLLASYESHIDKFFLTSIFHWISLFPQLFSRHFLLAESASVSILSANDNVEQLIHTKCI